MILGDLDKLLSPPLLSENLVFGQYSFHMAISSNFIIKFILSGLCCFKLD